ncbi:MAG TPA: ABC transporter substrate-binding protein [Acidimicrobiales bacterium]|nr:ABC transporter substrate-binding protein [Acidimicrobiales bacterium]
MLRLRFAGVAAASGLVAASLFLALPAGTASAAKSPIVIGYVSDLTGVASSTFTDGPGGARARIDAQNAQGGVNGHPLKLAVEDDQSSPTANLTASQDLVANKHAMVVVNFSAFAFGAIRYLNQQGIPVTGAGFDGPEWGEQPYSNMFSYAIPAESPINGVYYSYTTAGKFLKSIGATKYAGLAYGISESSQESIVATQTSAQKFGIKPCYLNRSVPFGGVDFTADVLQIKNAGCDLVNGSFVDNSDVALANAVKQAGIKAKQLYFTGYDQNILSSPAARAAFDGVYVSAGINFTTPNAATRQMIATLKRYDSSYTGGIPDLGLYGSYLATDLAIKGLQLAGKNPTPASFISHLRKVGSYNAGGILPSPVTFKGFATPAMFPKTSCGYYMQLQGDKFVVYSGKPVCGTRITVSFSSS